MSENRLFELLILLTLISFGFFGSLSHLFNILLISFVLLHYFKLKKLIEIDFPALLIFLSLSLSFFIFLIHGIFNLNYLPTLKSLSSMFPIPIVGFLILFQKNDFFKISSDKIANFSQSAVIFALIIYLILQTNAETDSILSKYVTGRMSLFSGNPIPFSFSMLGLSIFCLCDWKNTQKKQQKIKAICCFVIGCYFSGVLSGVRSMLFAILLILPIIIVYISQTRRNALISLSLLSTTIVTIVYLFKTNIISNGYFDHIENGLTTLLSFSKIESSVGDRLEMWSAAIKAISDSSIAGYGITERFSAILRYLPNTFNEKFTHPHNDILAGIISVGLLGGFLTIFTLISPFFAAVLSKVEKREKLYFGTMITITVLITANFSTVFFNDISSAWLAFSTYLICIIQFDKNKVSNQ